MMTQSMPVPKFNPWLFYIIASANQQNMIGGTPKSVPLISENLILSSPKWPIKNVRINVGSKGSYLFKTKK